MLATPKSGFEPVFLPRLPGAEALDRLDLARLWPGDEAAFGPWREAEIFGLAGLAGARSAPARVAAVRRCVSTMDLARDLAAEVLVHPFDAALAAMQSAGAGQAGKFWHSPAGNLHASFVLPVPPSGWDRLAPLLLGLAVIEGLESLGCPDLALKWPNDVLQRGAKTCGLLIRERSGLAVAGLGVNLALAPDLAGEAALPAAVLDFGASARPSGPLGLWAALVDFLRNWYGALFRTHDPGSFIGLVQARLAWRGREVVFSGEVAGGGGRGQILGLAQDGGLIVATGRGETILYASTIRLVP